MIVLLMVKVDLLLKCWSLVFLLLRLISWVLVKVFYLLLSLLIRMLWVYRLSCCEVML